VKSETRNENLVADYLSRILSDRESESTVSECFSNEQLYAVHSDPWYADFVNYLVAGRIPEGWTKNDRDRFFHLVKFFIWGDPYLFKCCYDQLFRRCIPDNKVRSVLSFCHDEACRGDFRGRKTAAKVLHCGFYWPTLFRGTFKYCKSCPRCQRLGRISRRDMVPLRPIIVVEIFDV